MPVRPWRSQRSRESRQRGGYGVAIPKGRSALALCATSSHVREDELSADHGGAETVYALAGVTRFFENRADMMHVTVFPVLPPPPDDGFFDSIVELRKRATAIAPDESEMFSRKVMLQVST